MQKKPALNVILGCWGRVDDGFVSCRSIENIILKIDEHIEHFNEMMNYFDGCRLFDRAMFEMSAINHFIYNMQDKFDQIAAGKRLWSEKQFHCYLKFIQEHKLCGLYIRLELDSPVKDCSVEEKTVHITATSKQTVSPPKINLKLIRGRRS